MRKKVVFFKYKGASVYLLLGLKKKWLASGYSSLKEVESPMAHVNSMKNVFAEPQVWFLKILGCFG